MNLDELIKVADFHKIGMLKELDNLKSDVKKIEDALRGLPIDEDFKFPILEEGDIYPVGELFISNERIYFHWTSEMNSIKVVLRPLVEYPIEIRIICRKFLIRFFHAILKELGANV